MVNWNGNPERKEPYVIWAATSLCCHYQPRPLFSPLSPFSTPQPILSRACSMILLGYQERSSLYPQVGRFVHNSIFEFLSIIVSHFSSFTLINFPLLVELLWLYFPPSLLLSFTPPLLPSFTPSLCLFPYCSLPHFQSFFSLLPTLPLSLHVFLLLPLFLFSSFLSTHFPFSLYSLLPL